MNIALCFPPHGTAVPYYDADNCDPAQMHEFVDLRHHPEHVDLLPELREAPELKCFLLAINDPETIFGTFGCNFEICIDESAEMDPDITASSNSQTEAAPTVIHSYIHVGFAAIDRCQNLDDYYRLCGRISKHLYEQTPLQSDATSHEIDVELAIGALWVDGDERGYVLTIVCDVPAPTVNLARARWSQVMSIISAFLTTEKLEIKPTAITDRASSAAELRLVVQTAARQAYKLWANRD